MDDAFEKFDLTGKTAFVTGGSAGLGFAMARGLARSGAKVMIAARREERLKEAAVELTATSGDNQVRYCTIDLSERDSISVAAEHALHELGGVDIYIGNAALGILEPIYTQSLRSVNKSLQVNVAANMSLITAFTPHMKEKQWGRVILSSSIGSQVSSPGGFSTIYSATKAALNGYTRAACVELGIDGITINSLVLGTFTTEMVTDGVAKLTKDLGPGAAEAFIQTLAAGTALNRLGDPAEVEGLVQFLASSAGSYVTGSEIFIDGGATKMQRPRQ